MPHEIIEHKLEKKLCGFHSGRSDRDQIFTLPQYVDKVWEYAKDVYIHIVDLKKTCMNKFSMKATGNFPEYDVDVWLLLSVPEVCVRVSRVKSQPFIVSVETPRICVLSALLLEWKLH